MYEENATPDAKPAPETLHAHALSSTSFMMTATTFLYQI